MMSSPTPGGNGLLSGGGLVAYYSLGSTADATGRGNTLTNNNVTTFVAGKVGNCANFVAASLQNLSRVSTADLALNDIDFTITCWVYLATKAADMGILSKGQATTEYKVSYVVGHDVFAVEIAGAALEAATFGAPSTGAWYFIAVTYTSANTTVTISVNDGVADTAGGTPPVAGAQPFQIGLDRLAGTYLDGKADEVGIWKKVLSSAQITALFNSYQGLPYSSFT